MEGRLFSNLLGDTEEDCENKVVESTLMRLEKRLVEAAFDARLDEVEMDHRLRFRKPSLRPPRLLDRECALEGRRPVFLGETESSNSGSLTGSEELEAKAGGGGGTGAGAFENGSWRAGCFLALSSAVILGGGSSDELRGSEAAEKEPEPWAAGGRLTAEDI